MTIVTVLCSVACWKIVENNISRNCVNPEVTPGKKALMSSKFGKNIRIMISVKGCITREHVDKNDNIASFIIPNKILELCQQWG